MSKIGNSWFYSSANPKNWDGKKVLAGFLATVIVGAAGFSVANVNSMVEDDKNIKAHVLQLDEKRDFLGDTIALKCGLDNFMPSSVELYMDNLKGHSLHFLGTQDNPTAINDIKTVVFQISQGDAESIARVIAQRDNNHDRTHEIDSSFGTFTFVKPKNEAKSFNKKSLEESAKLSDRVYAVLNVAVTNSTTHNVHTVDDVRDVNKALEAAYQKVNKEVANCERTVFENVDRQFVCNGLLTTGISHIEKDAINNTSSFCIDTIQSTNGRNFTHKKAVVTVAGSTLTTEEAFGKFIDGDYISFEELDPNKQYKDESKQYFNTLNECGVQL